MAIVKYAFFQNNVQDKFYYDVKCSSFFLICKLNTRKVAAAIVSSCTSQLVGSGEFPALTTKTTKLAALQATEPVDTGSAAEVPFSPSQTHESSKQ